MSVDFDKMTHKEIDACVEAMGYNDVDACADQMSRRHKDLSPTEEYALKRLCWRKQFKPPGGAGGGGSPPSNKGGHDAVRNVQKIKGNDRFNAFLSDADNLKAKYRDDVEILCQDGRIVVTYGHKGPKGSDVS